MLDINPEKSNIVTEDSLSEMIEIIIRNALMTPYESRVFNPKLGTNAAGLLQEPTHSVVGLLQTKSLVTSAIKRALPGIIISTNVTSKSSGRGTSDVRIKMTISYNGIYMAREYSSSKGGFTN